jgi:sulfatase maturation enzyme AslB (radical SAM superfamily)
MAKQREDNLKKFVKGQSGNPNGRPRKFVCTLKEQGYRLSEINDTIQVMMSMNLEELKAVWEDKNATVMEKTIASAIKKSIEKGSLYSLETLLSRVYGKPKEQVDMSNTGEISIKVHYDKGNNNTPE